VNPPFPTAQKAQRSRRAFDEELERFKRDVNLTELAASHGYRLVDRERSAEGKWRGSTQASVSMRHPDIDDKIIIRRDRDGHWPYFSVRDDRDNGTVVDFLQRRGQPSLGGIRKELRLWLRVDRPKLPVELYRPSVQIQERDAAAAAAAYSSASAARCRYLEDRGISREVAADRRFAGAYRLGARGNVLFPHCDPATGLVVGFEVKNNGFTSFATGGRKTTIFIGRSVKIRRCISLPAAWAMISRRATRRSTSTTPPSAGPRSARPARSDLYGRRYFERPMLWVVMALVTNPAILIAPAAFVWVLSVPRAWYCCQPFGPIWLYQAVVMEVRSM
jgi:hypothetical protein